ncbi:hypothetical protein GUITHDRAFT_106331 [Guillardia theta CCMP2712]|uniref:BACK domain-containing protein n=1 Tax=Guillardia theta (strain CCMP2712) TaxID=905079 RepID=L1JHK5_GUITC|nr:hypothetical protein GUITHDRAFT_106331 [Guillardia theta CCMP2712]EKX47777.1 hypothetical protein GUITHDRAFT_106331 [Guillardia theta CCMP2712]|eukprot:XP_005834757.1 hypothetical protein GUITHDRAFT_106331 [Guillardia theta CCMP2712]
MLPSTFRLVLKFLYTGEAELSAENLHGLMRAADVLGMEQLQQLCRQRVKQLLNISNCASIWGLAEDLGEEEVESKCREFVLDNFTRLLGSEGFVRAVRGRQVLELLRSEDLLLFREEDAVGFIMRWTDLDRTRRLPDAAALLREVRMGLLSRECMSELVEWLEQLYAPAPCDAPLLLLLKLLRDSHQQDLDAMEKKVRSLLESEARKEEHEQEEQEERAGATRSCLLSLSNSFRERGSKRRFLLAIGGKRGDLEVAVMSRYDTRRKVWIDMEPMSGGARYAHAVCSLRDQVYVAGGHLHSPLDTLELYDARDERWEKRATMLQPRSDFAMLVGGEKLFAIGGETTDVEVYDPERNQWSDCCPSLPLSHRSCRGTALNGRLFVLGGFDQEEDILSAVHSFDPIAMTWKAEPDMLEPRLACGAAVCCGAVYVVGGYNQLRGHLKAVDCLDPRVGRWQRTASCHLKRYDLSLANCGEMLYAMGGCDVEDACSAVVEVFDPRMNRWTFDPNMPFPLQYFGLASFESR